MDNIYKIIKEIKSERQMDNSDNFKIDGEWQTSEDGIKIIKKLLEEFRRELEQIVVEDVPHQYQERLLEKLKDK